MEILRAAIVSCCTEFVDFEDCSNLDEECFEAVMHQLRRVRVVLLKGTAVDENSAVMKRWRKDSDIHFVFSAVCKCCGAVKGRIKELRASTTTIYSMSSETQHKKVKEKVKVMRDSYGESQEGIWQESPCTPGCCRCNQESTEEAKEYHQHQI